MAFIQTEIFSSALGMATGVNVIIPEYCDNPRVLYLLHGLSDDQTMWMRRTSVERYADDNGFAVIMPTTYRGFYTDMAAGLNYWTYISEELPEKINKLFKLPTDREHTYAAGLSMGGYGALKLGLRRPDRFLGAASMSGAVDVKLRVQSSAEHKAIFGDTIKPEDDLFVLASELKKKPELTPRLYIWCGEQDGLLNENRRFKEHLDTLEIPVNYSESEGGHEWRRWDEQISKIMKWF